MSDEPRMPQSTRAGPIGWLFKLLVLVGKILYYFVRILLWILRRLRPGK
jgi:hypothetical protein